MITYRDAPRGCTIGLRIINVLLDGQLIGYIKAEPGGWRYWPAPIRVGKCGAQFSSLEACKIKAVTVTTPPSTPIAKAVTLNEFNRRFLPARYAPKPYTPTLVAIDIETSPQVITWYSNGPYDWKAISPIITVKEE